MQITHLFAGIPVGDLEAGLAWYELLFGRPPDMLPHEKEAVWHLIPGGSVYVMADAARAARARLTIAVSDLDALAGELAERGLAPERVPSTSGGPERLIVTDADGNSIALFEDPSPVASDAAT